MVNQQGLYFLVLYLGGLQQENTLPNTRKEGEKTSGEEELKDRE